MPLGFNLLLRTAGLDPGDVRLLRHRERAKPGHTPYEWWRDDLPLFQRYQARQSIANRPHLDAAHWAAFVVTTEAETLFAGLYRIGGREEITADAPGTDRDAVDPAGTCDAYAATLTDDLADLIGRVIIDWGPGLRAWIQRADRQDKPILEIRRSFQEPGFPGYQHVILPLSRVTALPRTWGAALRASRGVYLLTCPRTREQYVGAATGEGGFLGRWLDYAATGHGGNVALRSREASDYQVSILEVAGDAATTEDILGMEARWKAKLQSRDMGLNRN
ncbi:GIY-YIG nuclease family protein [Roseicella aquatilis]|uniref:GIY-YIG nuclease family protein n=1 Tax=Roseicella aquatilis TaxID=2527868 RepID=A0A4R4DGQ2_9PROT|nr:GIY-YIG nuclease family protein [Roseicella aquatilis]TCZ58560.1 GIY-YIG nuclease family protein [Roseicella aquatilis]